jgi:hypothetical protein
LESEKWYDLGKRLGRVYDWGNGLWVFINYNWNTFGNGFSSNMDLQDKKK